VPCPISRCFEITVTELSAPMRRKGVGSKDGADAAGEALAGFAAVASGGSEDHGNAIHSSVRFHT